MLQIVLFISLCNSYLVCCWPGVRCLSHFVHLFCTQDSRCHFYLLWCVNFPSPWTLTFVHFLTACYMLHDCSLAGEHILLLSVTWVGCGVCRWQGVMREGGAGQAQSRRKRLDWTLFVPLSHSLPLECVDITALMPHYYPVVTRVGDHLLAQLWCCHLSLTTCILAIAAGSWLPGT